MSEGSAKPPVREAPPVARENLNKALAWSLGLGKRRYAFLYLVISPLFL